MPNKKYQNAQDFALSSTVYSQTLLQQIQYAFISALRTYCIALNSL